MNGSHVTDAQGRRIHVPTNGRRIDGLVAEDKARTLTLFRPGNYSDHPTAPIDIAPRHDLLQGLPTHVKSILQERGKRAPDGFTPGTIELASTAEFLRLSGYQRYFLMLNEYDGTVEIGGKTYKVRRYHTVIELIMSPTTLKLARGRYTLAAIAMVQRRLDACRPTRDDIKKHQERFRTLMRRGRDKGDLAIHSAKLSLYKDSYDEVENRRTQSSMQIPDARVQLAREGEYHGRFIQPSYREWHEGETCYGMTLPWYTVSTDRIFSSVGDPNQDMDAEAKVQMAERVAERQRKRIVKATTTHGASDDLRYATEEPEKRSQLSFGDGMLTIVKQSDGARTISIDTSDPQAHDRAHDACRDKGGRWLPVSGRWHGDIDFAKRVVATLDAIPAGGLTMQTVDHVDPLPPLPTVDPLKQSPTNTKLYYFKIGNLEAAALKMELNWVLLPQKSQQIADIFTAACEPYAPTTPWDGDHKGNWSVRLNDRNSWIVRDEPPDLIRRVVSVIQNYKF